MVLIPLGSFGSAESWIDCLAAGSEEGSAEGWIVGLAVGFEEGSAEGWIYGLAAGSEDLRKDGAMEQWCGSVKYALAWFL